MVAFDGATDLTVGLTPIDALTYRASTPFVDATGIVTIEHLDGSTQLIHCGPFTARHS